MILSLVMHECPYYNKNSTAFATNIFITQKIARFKEKPLAHKATRHRGAFPDYFVFIFLLSSSIDDNKVNI